MSQTKNEEQSFTPALGRTEFTWAYDFAIRLLTRERVWRDALLAQVAPNNYETILDVGCGTGTFAIMLKRNAPKAQIIGLDPDPEALALAARKAESMHVDVEWRQGFARDAASSPADYDKAVSSLMFHQMPLAEKCTGFGPCLMRCGPAASCTSPIMLISEAGRCVVCFAGPYSA